MPFKPDDLERLLVQKFAFEAESTREKGHRWFVLRLPGLPPIRTKLSHSKKTEYGAQLEGAMARQLHVRLNYFRDMMGCKNSREAYYAQVQSDPFPPFPI